MSKYWEDTYRNGHRQSYPWDVVVSFVFRNAPSDRPRDQIRILEVGCGTGSNLWFAAREGLSVSGIELSSDAIRMAEDRFAAEGLIGDFRIGSFDSLPFADEDFDLVVDRAALTCADRSTISRAVREIGRVTRPGGRFFMNCYADDHTSAGATSGDGSGTVVDVETGSLAGLDRITFFSRDQLLELLDEKWSIESLSKLELRETIEHVDSIHTEWRVVARRS
ncbi:MAG: class I SAM-dependent methyltransferase [Rhizobiaceae bacterium]